LSRKSWDYDSAASKQTWAGQEKNEKKFHNNGSENHDTKTLANCFIRNKTMIESGGPLSVRPFQLMCIICKIGAGQHDIQDSKLKMILNKVREKPHIPLKLCCNTDSVFKYQNPGRGDNTPEGDSFNEKRDLDILQKLGLVPGSTRPAYDLFSWVLKNITTAHNICGYGADSQSIWKGCVYADSGNYENGCRKGIAAVIPARNAKTDAKRESVKIIYQSGRLLIRPHHLMCMACFYGQIDNFKPIEEDNLYEVIDVMQKNPEIPVTLVKGCCMICPPCSKYDSETGLCVGGNCMALRDQKKDLDVLQKLGLDYGSVLPAKELFRLLFEKIQSSKQICAWGDGIARSPEWSICESSDRQNNELYKKGRKAGLGFL
jgi:hypothetical protein